MSCLIFNHATAQFHLPWGVICGHVCVFREVMITGSTLIPSDGDENVDLAIVASQEFSPVIYGCSDTNVDEKLQSTHRREAGGQECRRRVEFPMTLPVPEMQSAVTDPVV